MASPLSASAFKQALIDEGCKVVTHTGWDTHNRGDRGDGWGPVHGVMNHHTVSNGEQKTFDIVWNGYAGLPGPLCHVMIAKNGNVHLVGYGRANHAGLGDDDVLAAMIAGRDYPIDNEANTDGNARFYGGEYENMGDGRDPWPAAQLDAIIKFNAAVIRAHRKKGDNWQADDSILGHLEWQPGKSDPRGFSMDWLRDEVHKRLQTTPGVTKLFHTVVEGDTMWAIARKYKKTVAALMKLNPSIHDADEILPGQKVRYK
ncbi:N-acetylmuramoyl-L-alanine amidase [Streptomyces sp. NPDC006477]|uniref:N-acetylmuramoyl-L-alanine amidase n=1 Tax=Streptomyces sp. NPDC006477 TaxID=3364747 RepID=UPI0036A2A56A